MKKVLAVLAVLVVGTLLMQVCPRPPVKPDHTVSDALREAFDSSVVSRERFQRLLADSAWKDSVARHEAAERHASVSADSLRSKRLSLRGRPNPALPAPSPADPARLLAQLDTVTQERDLAIQEADSLRVALVHADSAKAYITAQLRVVLVGADSMLRSQIWAEGRLSWALPQVGKLERDIVTLRRGCRIPLVGLKCPVIGPGLVMGTDFKPQLGIAVVIPL